MEKKTKFTLHWNQFLEFSGNLVFTALKHPPINQKKKQNQQQSHEH